MHARLATLFEARADNLEPLNELFRTAFDEAPIGMCLVAPDGRLIEVNASLCRMMGYPAEELLKMRVEDLTHPDDRPANLALLADLVSGRRDRYEIRKTNVRKDHIAVPVQVNVAAVRDETGTLLYIVAQIQDLTGHLEAERVLRAAEEAHRKSLEQQARQDSLTGLPNRRELLCKLDGALRRTARASGGLALMFCDVDNFKAVNDFYGHAVGDELLVEVARRLRDCAGEDELVCRFGGDEFVFLAEGVSSLANASRIAYRFASAFDRPFYAAGREFPATLSMGVAFAAPGCTDPSDVLMRNADTAMYRAKALGRNQVVTFTEALRSEMLKGIELERDLRVALLESQIICHYQPILDLGRRGVVRAEALVRWKHPRRGLVSPLEFLGVAEKTGLVVDMGEQVLAHALARATEWRSAGMDVGVAVNLASQQLDAELPRKLERLLDAARLPPEKLCLELTESALFSGHDANLKLMRDLSAVGVRLAVDDFGTGYSSFAYLRDLPVNEVKLDRSFIHSMNTSERNEKVVAGMIRLAHELGLTVVAEGVETQEQLDTLLVLGCDEAQGYLFARPSENPLAIEATAPLRAVASR
jgi:diguanylate cyclase (GGDEF)-like protein/PAS domain S-box-containing protein